MSDRILLVFELNNPVYTGEVSKSRMDVSPETGEFRISGEGERMDIHTLDWLVDYVDRLMEEEE